MQIHGKAGTVGGTLLTVIVNIQGVDILKTCILAAIGAVISFCVSMVMKRIVKYFKNKNRS
jgi:uncharacterized membrane protein YgaE (UPF0421/DUF939 family)